MNREVVQIQKLSDKEVKYYAKLASRGKLGSITEETLRENMTLLKCYNELMRKYDYQPVEKAFGIYHYQSVTAPELKPTIIIILKEDNDRIATLYRVMTNLVN